MSRPHANAPHNVTHKSTRVTTKPSNGKGRLFGVCCALGIGASIAAHAALSTPEAMPKESFTSNITGVFSPVPQEVYASVRDKHEDMVVGKGDTLISMLLRHDIDNQQAHRIANALKEEYDLRKLRVGQSLQLVTAPIDETNSNAFKRLEVRLPLSTITVSENEAKELAANRVDIPFESVPFHGHGEVTSSLYQASYDADIPVGAMNEIVSAFSFDVDFQRDIHPGNRIEVMVDTKVTESGDVIGYENARYAKLNMKKRTLEIFKFTNQHGHEDWFDAKGNSVRKSLLRTPVNAARISSGFGMRRHPILGYNKMHKGVDFAAPTGTPIYAAGDGVVDYKGRRGGYGNYIRIRHNGTYQTAYAHMHRYAKGMRRGTRVKQGQVIGYVGSTGRSTGPHLHYEVIQKGRQVNPRHAKFNAVEPLKGKTLTAFKKHIRAVNTELAQYRQDKAPKQLAKLDVASAN